MLLDAFKCLPLVLVACGTSPAVQDSGAPDSGGDAIADAQPDVGDSAADGSVEAGPTATTITVLNGDGNSILSWPIGANGNAAPSSVISGSNTLLNVGNAMTADSAGNIYVAQRTELLVFAPHANGNVAPTRVLQGSNVVSGNYIIDDVSVSSSGEIYVTMTGQQTDVPKLEVFAAQANGNAAPTRIISGSNTTLKSPQAITTFSGVAYVTDGSNVLAFDANANGNVAPQRSWSLPSTNRLSLQLVADPAGNLYVPDCVLNSPSSANTAIYVFPPNTSAPSRTLSGANTELTVTNGVAVDADGAIFATNGEPTAPAVLVYAPNANGGAAPTRNISGPSTTLKVPGIGYVLYIAVY